MTEVTSFVESTYVLEYRGGPKDGRTYRVHKDYCMVNTPVTVNDPDTFLSRDGEEWVLAQSFKPITYHLYIVKKGVLIPGAVPTYYLHYEGPIEP